MTNLTSLFLGSNRLTGPIPPELANLTNLTGLGLAKNQLTGSIPPELGNMTSLEALYLNGNQLTGPIPPELANLPNLRALYLANDQLTGCVPPALLEKKLGGTDIHGGWMSTRDCDAADSPAAGNAATDRQVLEAFYHAAGGPNWEQNDNWLSEEPLGLWHGVSTNIDGRVTELRLQRNGMSGSIPPELGDLAYLRLLMLHTNQLTGSVPPELGNLTALFYFTLEENQLTGCIPRKPESERLRHEPALPLCP